MRGGEIIVWEQTGDANQLWRYTAEVSLNGRVITHYTPCIVTRIHRTGVGSSKFFTIYLLSCHYVHYYVHTTKCV